jgi:NTP pyrophosphatase (non-canonical NTP hydrolase)
MDNETSCLPRTTADGRIYPDLTPAELERLALVMEEASEVVQAATKILRHGYEGRYDEGPTNREALERELGDLRYAIALLIGADDISESAVFLATHAKAKRAPRFLRHQIRAVLTPQSMNENEVRTDESALAPVYDAVGLEEDAKTVYILEATGRRLYWDGLARGLYELGDPVFFTEIGAEVPEHSYRVVRLENFVERGFLRVYLCLAADYTSRVLEGRPE